MAALLDGTFSLLLPAAVGMSVGDGEAGAAVVGGAGTEGQVSHVFCFFLRGLAAP